MRISGWERGGLIGGEGTPLNRRFLTFGRIILGYSQEQKNTGGRYYEEFTYP